MNIWIFSDIQNCCLAELRDLDLQTGLFTLKQMKAATKNFDAANNVGEGVFASVFKVTECLMFSLICPYYTL